MVTGNVESEKTELSDLILLILGIDPGEAKKPSIFFSQIYVKAIKAIYDGHLDANIEYYKYDLSKHVQIRLKEPCYYLNPREFIAFCLDKNIRIDERFFKYFDGTYWAEKEALTIDEAVTLLYYLPQNYIPFSHEIITSETISDSINQEKVSEITQTLHSALKNEELGGWPSYTVEPKDETTLILSDKETGDEQIFIAPIKLLYWDILQQKKYPEIEKLLKRLIDDFHYKVEDGWFELINESDYNKAMFLLYVINEVILQRSNYFIIDKSLYTKRSLSLHEIACLTLNINPDIKAPPYHLDAKYKFIIEEIRRDVMTKEVTDGLEIKVRERRSDLRTTYVNSQSYKQWFIRNRKSFEQKFITMNPDFQNSVILDPGKKQLRSKKTFKDGKEGKQEFYDTFYSYVQHR